MADVYEVVATPNCDDPVVSHEHVTLFGIADSDAYFEVRAGSAESAVCKVVYHTEDIDDNQLVYVRNTRTGDSWWYRMAEDGQWVEDDSD